MMRLPWAWIFNFCCFFVLFNLSCAFQTTLWYQIFGQVPSPLIWILPPIYLIVTRPGFGSLFICYFLTFIASRYSSIHLSHLLIVMSIIAFFILSLRSRIYWAGPSYYLLISFGSLFSFHVFSLIASFILEVNSAPVLFWDRLIQVILTLGFCYPLFLLMKKIDQVFSTQDGFIQGLSHGEQREL